MRRDFDSRPLHDGGFLVFDTFLDQVAQTVGRTPVESGGAILGDYTSGVITTFLFDRDAETTSSSYIPSRQLSRRVNESEDVNRLQFKGVLHSHPGNFDIPSGPDSHSFWVGLKENPELSRYLAPIVTFAPGRERINKIPLPGGGWITFYVVLRDGSREVQIEPTMPDIIYFARDCRSLTSLLNLDRPIFSEEFNGTTSVVTALIRLSNDLVMYISADGSYPENPPQIILHQPTMQSTSQLNLRWSIGDKPDERLLRSLSDVLIEPNDSLSGLAFGLGGIPMTEKVETGLALNLDPILVGSQYPTRLARIEEGLFARSKGLLSENLSSCRVLINGAGSVGSYVAEQLVRSGVGGVTLLDPDTVEYANLSRTNFSAADIGARKIDALARRLLLISPSLNIHFVPSNLHDLEQSELDALFSENDLIICAVDDRRAQLLINHFAYHHRKPAIFIGIYRGARSGEVCFVEHPLSCFDCATRFRGDITAESDRDTDYGTGQLVAEVALGIDIQAITAAGIRLALSRLVRDDQSSLSKFVTDLNGRQYAILGVDPEVDILDEVMRGVPAQYGYRSIWLSVPRNDDCVVCGTAPIGPMATVKISSSEINDALRDLEGLPSTEEASSATNPEQSDSTGASEEWIGDSSTSPAARRPWLPFRRRPDDFE